MAQSNIAQLKENPMRHSWKIAAGFLLAGLVILWLRSSMAVSDTLAVPTLLLCAIGFPAFVVIGSLSRKSRG